jgi:hypothetical protein
MHVPDFFFFRNVFLAAAASLLAASAFVLSAIPVNYPISLSIGLLTFSVYQLASFHPSVQHFRISFQRKPGYWNAASIFLATFIGFFQLPICLYPPVILAGILSILYFLQWQKGKFAGGLRSVFLLKNFLVAFVWTLCTLQLPVWPMQPGLMETLSRFLLILLITFGLDLRDAAADRKLGVMTLASQLGFKNAKWVLILLCIGCIWICMSIDFNGAAMLGLTFIVLLTVVLYLKEHTSYWTYFLMLDGILILHALFILLLRLP